MALTVLTLSDLRQIRVMRSDAPLVPKHAGVERPHPAFENLKEDLNLALRDSRPGTAV